MQESPKIENGCSAFHVCFVGSDWRLLVCTVQIMTPLSDNKTIKASLLEVDYSAGIQATFFFFFFSTTA